MTLLLSTLGLLAGTLVGHCVASAAAGSQPLKRPTCAYCGRHRPWWAWCATLAHLRLRPACSSCGAPIPWRYVTAELATAATYGLLWQQEGPGVLLAFHAALSSLLVFIALWDSETGRIPLFPLCLAAVAAGASSLFHQTPPLMGNVSPDVPSLREYPFCISALCGGASGLSLLYAIRGGGRLFLAAANRHRARGLPGTAFGLGDVWLGGVIGLALGLPDLLTALLLAILLAGLGALILLGRRWRVHRFYVPFGSMAYSPFLVAGALITLLFHPPLPAFLQP